MWDAGSGRPRRGSKRKPRFSRSEPRVSARTADREVYDKGEMAPLPTGEHVLKLGKKRFIKVIVA